MITVYITVGNSDDKLSQKEWAAFQLRTHLAIVDAAQTIHGSWYSGPAAEWQNACWCAEVPTDRVDRLRNALRLLAREFRQDSIAWAEAPAVEFLTAPSRGLG